MSDRTTGVGELPGLAPGLIDILAGSWTGAALWAEVRWLADQFWAAADPADQRVRWHHLVLAVGNFKREGGRRLHPAGLPELANPEVLARDEFEMADGTRVVVENAQSWRALSAHLRGSGVATTTTLLAALWPDRHFVFDRRVRAAASGVRIAADRSPCPSVQRAIAGAKLAPITFEDYAIVRGWLKSSSRPFTQTERALYELSRRVKPQTERTWNDYAAAVKDELEKVAGSA